MNKTAQIGIFFGLMLFIAGMWVMAITVRPVKQIIDTQRGAEYLNCTSTDLSTGGVLACLGTDIILPIYVLAFIGAAGGAIFSATKIGT